MREFCYFLRVTSTYLVNILKHAFVRVTETMNINLLSVPYSCNFVLYNGPVSKTFINERDESKILSLGQRCSRGGARESSAHDDDVEGLAHAAPFYPNRVHTYSGLSTIGPTSP